MQDPDLFSKLATFLDKDLDLAEREQVLTKTIPRMVERAKALKSTKPPQGLHFSLQQQGTVITRFLAISRKLQNTRESGKSKENCYHSQID